MDFPDSSIWHTDLAKFDVPHQIDIPFFRVKSDIFKHIINPDNGPEEEENVQIAIM